MPKWLVICLDGTWNTAVDEDETPGSAMTNVVRFYDLLSSRSHDEWEQLRYYESGVGTNWWERLTGGGFGLGLDRHIKNAYRWLTLNYSAGDKIAILGFSRGAYTARSLVGLLRQCWLLDRDSVAREARSDRSRVEYQRKYNKALLQLSRQAYVLYQRREGNADDYDSQDFRSRYCRHVKVNFLGVWDTVGALGVPLWVFQRFLNPSKYGFHDTKLSGIVERAYHAIAIDEHREDYAVSLWDNKPEHHNTQIVEQCWFIGSHADVGGGYKDSTLADISLGWMQDKARALGIAMAGRSYTDNAYLVQPHDSYIDFLGRLYSKLKPRYFRTMAATLQEDVHKTVLLRHYQDVNYRPLNLGYMRLINRDKHSQLVVS
jgi:uncharacterized protein (DUF2235 family)